jgi:hypothetical protein
MWGNEIQSALSGAGRQTLAVVAALVVVCCNSCGVCFVALRYPIIMDAMASEVQRKGDAFMSKWAEIMTNMQPKTYFFRWVQTHCQLIWILTQLLAVY